jgi:hypothetical protein
MQVFISWSGNKSHSIAIVLRTYLKLMLQNLSPYLSSEDIKKGKRWSVELSKTLNNVKFGIICLTKENLNSEWILFEAGAISKSLEDARVFTLLFDNLTPSEIKGPLAHFQHTLFNKNDFEKLLYELYNLLEEKPIDSETLKKSFNTFWPHLEGEIIEALKKSEIETSLIAERTEKDYLQDILLSCRQILYNQESVHLKDIANYSDQELLSPDKSDFNHPIKIVIDPVATLKNGENKLVRIIVEKDSIKMEEAEYPIHRRGIQIAITFRSEYEKNLWELIFTFHKGNTYVESSRLPLDESITEIDTIWRD